MDCQQKRKRNVLLILLLLSFISCKSIEKVTTDNEQHPGSSGLAQLFTRSEVFSDNFTGFMLYDPVAKRTLYTQNEKRYFTPASNTKLFTFYTGLKLLPSNIPALTYVERGDSLIFWGTGDPTFLRSDLNDGTVFDFLKKSSKKLYYSDSNYRDQALGPGWSWSDYQYAYSAEKSPLPMYGNLVRFKMLEVTNTTLPSGKSGLQISPPIFQSYLQQASNSDGETDQPVLFRGFDDNHFQYLSKTDTSTFFVDKPFHYTPRLITELLSDTLGKPVKYLKRTLPADAKKLYSISADTLYKHMLQPSDNFIAEQVLLMTASEMGKPLSSSIVIEKMKHTWLAGMPDEPQWADGSGLSRYNLFTPRSMVWLLQKIRDEFETDEKLFELLATGGESGTLRNWYAARDGGPPYVFAKTGTLSNNHCLAGFIKTKSGQTLLFSFMNNHYVTSTSVVKEAMEKTLWYIHQYY